MAIIYQEAEKIFHLSNKKVSYVIRIMENGHLENLYYGKAIHNPESFVRHHEECGRSHLASALPGVDTTLGLQYTRNEYPVYGTGDFRSPAVTIHQENGSRIVNFVYQEHKIYKGKPSMHPIPATYVESEDEADTLEVTLRDEVCGTDLILTYTIYADEAVITRNARFFQFGSQTVQLERALSASVEFLDMDFEMIHLAGAWSRERYVKTRKLEMGIQAIQNLNGTGSGADHNPFIALKRPHTTENAGEVYGFNFVYSGNFLAQVEVSTHDMTRVMMGISPEGFEWILNSGETFQTPEVIMVYSAEGLNGMSQTFHRLYRKRMVRGVWRDQARPILLNNWEATYFDFNEEKILKIAEKAKEAGIELFVLDDGWFGARNDDYRGLGDWYVNLEKLPNGITGLAQKVEALGLKFGLWVELEMVNKDSDLYREHPDWVIGAPGRYETPSRHQHVLDFSRKEVVDYIYEMIAKILREAPISYIKWDMNRYMTEPYSRGTDPALQGMVMHKYILGVYDLYDRLTSEFPEILFESCASGGARFDAAMLYYAPQAWCSDDTDACERMKIQYGTSYAYPIVSMGSHVSAVPNHQLHRITPIDTRAAVAYFGTFGYELDLNLLPEEEMEQVKKQVEYMKANRDLIQIQGDFYRLKSPFEGNDTAWMVVAPDKSEAIAAFYQKLNKVNASWLRLKLEGLDPDAVYEVSMDMMDTFRAYGDELMYAGIPLNREHLYKKGGDFTALIYNLKRV